MRDQGANARDERPAPASIAGQQPAVTSPPKERNGLGGNAATGTYESAGERKTAAPCTTIRCQTCDRATDDPAHKFGCACACNQPFARQTAIMDSLPHACTMARLENWRVAADEFVRYLNARGYDVVKVDPAPAGNDRPSDA